jgi:hypothetical protein
MMPTFMPAVLSMILRKPAELWELLRACGANGVTIMLAVLLTISTKPAEIWNLLGACGANDADFYACGALNDANKTCGARWLIKSLRSNDVIYYPAVHPDYDKPCGAVRLTRNLRSWRWFLLLRHFVSTWVWDYEHCSVIVLMSSWHATLCVEVGYRARLLRRTPGASLAPPARLVDSTP